MKSSSFYAIGVVLASLVAVPASAATTYVGAGFLTDLTSSCTSVGFFKNLEFTLVYRPRTNTEPGVETLLLQFQNGAVGLEANSGGTDLVGPAKFYSSGISDKAVVYGAQGNSNLAIKVSSDASSATIAGKITNLYGDQSCVLTIRAAATKRPE